MEEDIYKYMTKQVLPHSQLKLTCIYIYYIYTHIYIYRLTSAGCGVTPALSYI